MSLLMHGPQQRAWVEINRDAITHNTRCIKASLGEHCELMAVVKADGYGHGAVTVAEAAIKGGAPAVLVLPPLPKQLNYARPVFSNLF